MRHQSQGRLKSSSCANFRCEKLFMDWKEINKNKILLKSETWADEHFTSDCCIDAPHA